MSEESAPKKKAARKTTRKRSTKKAAKAATATVTEDSELPLANEEAAPATSAEVPAILPGESLSSSTANGGSDDTPEPKAKKSAKSKKAKSGVRDARKNQTADEEVSEPLIKEVDEELVIPEIVDDSPEREEKSEKPEKNEKGRRRGRGRGRDREERPRIEVDHGKLTKKAWKIFHSEVTEEGLALLDDRGLRDYARSSFNAARIFLEEEHRTKEK